MGNQPSTESDHESPDAPEQDPQAPPHHRDPDPVNSPASPDLKPRRKKKKSKKTKSAEVVRASDDEANVPTTQPETVLDEPLVDTIPVHAPADYVQVKPEMTPVAAAPEKKKRKKKRRAENAEPSSSRPEPEWPDAAQALIGLSKGVAGPGDGDTVEQTGMADETQEAPPEKRKKRKSKKVLSQPMVTDEPEEPELENSKPQPEPQEAAADVDMVDAGQSTAYSQPDQTAGFEAIISQHLATHMSKLPPPSPQPQDASSSIQQGFANGAYMPPSQIPLASIPNTQDLQIRTVATPAKKTRTKRKRSGAAQGAADPNGLVDPQLMELDQVAAPFAETLAPPAKRKRQRRPAAGVVIEKFYDDDDPVFKKPKKEGKEDDTPGGTFSVEERFAIDKALQKYKEDNEMDENALRNRIWGNQRRKDEFWNEICQAVPTRSRASVYKHVRRTYHVFEMRAKWTDEEDDQLAALVKAKGNRWKDIGEAMERMGEDCRDRYRNYVKCGKTRGTDRWTEEEEELLKHAVTECQRRAAEDLATAGRQIPADPEELINWTRVSDDIGNIRSRIQCRYKWRKMAAQRDRVITAPVGITYVGGKKKRIIYDIKEMLPGDKLWLLTQIRDSGATLENEIPWDRISKEDREVGIWNHKDLKSAYKALRAHIPYRRRPLAEIIRQLLDEHIVDPNNADPARFVPDPSLLYPQPDAYEFSPHSHVPAPIAHMTQQHHQHDQHQQQKQIAVDPSLMDPPPPPPPQPSSSSSQQPQQHAASSPQPPQQQQAQIPKMQAQEIAAAVAAQAAQAVAVADGDLSELERTAGEAIAYSQAMTRQGQGVSQAGGAADGLDENEKQLREQLTRFVARS